jgi:hypothetical protein
MVHQIMFSFLRISQQMRRDFSSEGIFQNRQSIRIAPGARRSAGVSDEA